MNNKSRPRLAPRRIFALTLVALGIALAVPFGNKVLMSARASAGWPHTDGTIRDARLASEELRDGSLMYRAQIVYTYRVDGQDYEARRIRFGAEASASPVPDRAERWVSTYRPGAGVAVYYNPSSPTEAVLEPGARAEAYALMALGVLLTVVGGIIAARGARRER